MPKTIKIGSSGSEVLSCQKRLNIHKIFCSEDGSFGPKTERAVKDFQRKFKLDIDGIVGPTTWKFLNDEPKSKIKPADKSEKDWMDLVPLLGPAMNARYQLSYAQMPKFPKGVDFLSSKYLGEEKTNCTMFTSYFVGNGFDVSFNIDQWKRWQLSGGEHFDYRGYGPGVCAEWGIGTMMPDGALPENGVYLLQTIKSWPRGHSWLIIDYDKNTDKILTLESNTVGFGLDGIGFGGIGPIRSTDAKNWVNRTRLTWKGRTEKLEEIKMCKLNINHDSVKDWIK